MLPARFLGLKRQRSKGTCCRKENLTPRARDTHRIVLSSRAQFFRNQREIEGMVIGLELVRRQGNLKANLGVRREEVQGPIIPTVGLCRAIGRAASFVVPAQEIGLAFPLVPDLHIRVEVVRKVFHDVRGAGGACRELDICEQIRRRHFQLGSRAVEAHRIIHRLRLVDRRGQLEDHRLIELDILVGRKGEANAEAVPVRARRGLTAISRRHAGVAAQVGALLMAESCIGVLRLAGHDHIGIDGVRGLDRNKLGASRACREGHIRECVRPRHEHLARRAGYLDRIGYPFGVPFAGANGEVEGLFEPLEDVSARIEPESNLEIVLACAKIICLNVIRHIAVERATLGRASAHRQVRLPGRLIEAEFCIHSWIKPRQDILNTSLVFLQGHICKHVRPRQNHGYMRARRVDRVVHTVAPAISRSQVKVESLIEGGEFRSTDRKTITDLIPAMAHADAVSAVRIGAAAIDRRSRRSPIAQIKSRLASCLVKHEIDVHIIADLLHFGLRARCAFRVGHIGKEGAIGHDRIHDHARDTDVVGHSRLSHAGRGDAHRQGPKDVLVGVFVEREPITHGIPGLIRVDDFERAIHTLAFTGDGSALAALVAQPKIGIVRPFRKLEWRVDLGIELGHDRFGAGCSWGILPVGEHVLGRHDRHLDRALERNRIAAGIALDSRRANRHRNRAIELVKRVLRQPNAVANGKSV